MGVNSAYAVDMRDFTERSSPHDRSAVRVSNHVAALFDSV